MRCRSKSTFHEILSYCSKMRRGKRHSMLIVLKDKMKLNEFSIIVMFLIKVFRQKEMRSFTTAAPSRILTSPIQSRSGGGRCITSSTWSCLASWSPPWRCWASRCPRTPGRSWDCVSVNNSTWIHENCTGIRYSSDRIRSQGIII